MHNSNSTEERRHILRRNSDHFQDEISLQDLYFVLVKQKRVILLILVASVIASVLYVMFAPKIYQVSARIIIPGEDDLVLSNRSQENLEPAGNGLARSNPVLVVREELKDKLNPAKKIFTQFQTVLLKDGSWNNFVNGHRNLFQAQENNNSSKVVRNPIELGKDDFFVGDHVVVKYFSSNLEDISTVLEQYIEFARQEYITQLIASRVRRIEREIESLKLDIKQARQQETIKRQDEIAIIKNDLAIAKKLNLTENSSLTVAASNINVPRYLRGTKVLTAELESLQNRTSDDPYISGLRDKQQKLEKLEAIKFTETQFSPFILDGSIQAAEKIKPKSGLILVSGLVLGIFFGLFMAFIVEFIQKTQKSGS